MHLLAAAAAKQTFWRTLRHLGGPGLVLLGLVDNSFIPVPGSMDALTIILSSSHKEPWWYYAIMATLGAVIGGYLTYRIGLRGGKETLEKRISKKRAERIYHVFERYGFWSVLVGAMSPPPVPIVPFLVTAGAMKYSRNRFLAALALGRAVRYTLLAYLGSLYGYRLFRRLGRYYEPLLYTLILAAVIAGLLAIYYLRRYHSRKFSRSDSKRHRHRTRQSES